MGKIVLANNAEYNVSYCAALDGVMSFEITDTISMSTANTVFGDSTKTATIKYVVNDSEATFTSYTTLIGITKDRWSGNTTVRLELSDASDAIVDIEILPIEWEVIDNDDDGGIIIIEPEE